MPTLRFDPRTRLLIVASAVVAILVGASLALFSRDPGASNSAPVAADVDEQDGLTPAQEARARAAVRIGRQTAARLAAERLAARREYAQARRRAVARKLAMARDRAAEDRKSVV